MTVEVFCRVNNLPSTTVRRCIKQAETPAEVGVIEGGTISRPSYTVDDPGRLLDAVTRHVGSGAIPPAAIYRLHAVARHALEAETLPSGVSADTLRADLDMLRAPPPQPGRMSRPPPTMPEHIHPLSTEAARLGVSPSTLSEAVSKGRQCAGRDVMGRARFDAKSGRCVGFVPADDYGTYAHADVPAPAPLTAEEAAAVQRGDLTPEQAEEEARARVAGASAPSVPVEAYATNPGRWANNPGEWEDEEARIERRAAEIAATQLAEREAQRRAAEKVAQAQPAPVAAVAPVAAGDDEPEDDEPEDTEAGELDAYEEAAAWLIEMNQDDRRAFILEYGETYIEEEVKDRLEDMAAADRIGRDNAANAKSVAAAVAADEAHDAASGEGYALPESEDGDMGGRLVAVDLDGDGDADAVVEEKSLGLLGAFKVIGHIATAGAFLEGDDEGEDSAEEDPEDGDGEPADETQTKQAA